MQSQSSFIGFRRVQTVEIQQTALEAFVLKGLDHVMNAVAEADPENSRLNVDLSDDKPSDFADAKCVAHEIARRIQLLSPDWIVRASASDSHMITMERRRKGEPAHDIAGGFSISAVQQQKLLQEGAAITATVTAVHNHFRTFGRADDFAVPFPDDSPSFYVLRQAARRIQSYSADWTISADAATRTIRGTRLAIPGPLSDNV